MAEQARGMSGWRWARSVALGTLAVAGIAGLAPYNDFIVNNTFLILNYLPIGVVLLLCLLVVVNAPLCKWKPAWALSGGELAVVTLMTLAGCGLPCQGLNRQLVPMLVSPFHYGAQNPIFWRSFVSMGLPAWMFPVHGDAGMRDSIVVDLYGSLPPGAPIPFGAWVIPLAGWGVFYGALYTTLLSLAALVRAQWAENERLPFPIAQLEVALISPPEKGRAFNAVLGSKLFWVAALFVVAIHGVRGLHQYYPRQFPQIPVGYDFTTIMGNEPWTYTSEHIQKSTLYFTLLGVAYFVQSRVAFSIWATFFLGQCFIVQQRVMQVEIPDAAWQDQHLGASVVLLLSIVWIGRRHWWNVVRQMLFLHKPREGERGTWLTYRVAAYTAVLGVVVMMAWLLLVGVSFWISAGIVFFAVMAHVLIARFVAETGIPYMRSFATLSQVVYSLPTQLFSTKDVFFTGVFQMTGTITTRESEMVYATHAMRVADEFHESRPARRALFGLLAWSIFLSFVVSAASGLWCYYRYSGPLPRDATTVENVYGLENWPTQYLVSPLRSQTEGHFPARAHNPVKHVAIGAGITFVLQVLSLRYLAWPFLPIGYWAQSTWYAGQAWFSLMLGWLAKLMILRFGGAQLFQKLKPLFIGLIFGEAFAAGTWLIVNLVLAASGHEYRNTIIFPS